MALDRALPLATSGFGAILARALRLRCPRCGQGRLYLRGFVMAERCPACGLAFEREQGYFVGAIYVNYGLTVVVALGGAWLLDRLIGLSLAAQLTIAVGVAAALPLVLFRHARSLWLGLDFWVTRADERSERRRHGRR